MGALFRGWGRFHVEGGGFFLGGGGGADFTRGGGTFLRGSRFPLGQISEGAQIFSGGVKFPDTVIFVMMWLI